MNLVEFVTAVGFFGLMAILLVKLLNVMNQMSLYQLDKGIILFVASLILYFGVMVSTMTAPSIYMAALLNFSRGMVLIIFFLTIAESLLHIKTVVVREPLRARR